MCIRDRVTRDACAAAAVLDRIVVSIHTDRLAGDVPVPCRAGSYTHLRAHETVLDLVCRLLLEKKNSESLDDVRRVQGYRLYWSVRAPRLFCHLYSLSVIYIS